MFYFGQIALFILLMIAFFKGEREMLIMLFIAITIHGELGAIRKKIGGQQE